MEILAPVRGRAAEILTPEACTFLAELTRVWAPRRRELLALHARRREAGEIPDFRRDTADVRFRAWQVPPLPPGLADRRVEIVGPADRATLLAGLFSGASGVLADLEDATSPTWENVLDSQVHLRDAVRRTLWAADEEVYALAGEVATLHVRPRGWHLPEKHLRVDGEPVAAAFVDVGLFLFHNARELAAQGRVPCLYLAKLAGLEDARFWRDVLRFAEGALELRAGTIRATAMIETLPAAFEAEEILWELGEHALGLACGRWDYLFSCIKTLGRDRQEGALFPERSRLTMDAPFLDAYCRHVIGVCRRRGGQAIGGMAAQVPVPGDPEANAAALARVRADKEREAALGFDGAWVGHPGLVPIAREAFSRGRERPGETALVSRDELLAVPRAGADAITEAGVRRNLSAGVRYLGAWLGGQGWVALDHLLADAAIAEISRCQLWQWLRGGVSLGSDSGPAESGRILTAELYRRLLQEEMAGVAGGNGAGSPEDLSRAAELFLGMVESPVLDEFLTLRAYESLP